MILFDTSAVLDLFDKESPFNSWARKQFVDAVSSEGAGANAVTVAEASIRALEPEKIPARMQSVGFTLLDLPVAASIPAARAYAVYLDRRKREKALVTSRNPLPDFFIGAHAEASGMSLVTRDPDRVQKYFPGVRLITP